MSKLQVGGDLLYFCPRCQLKLAHTILAMIGAEPARIRCNTCRSERNYRAKKIISSNTSAPRLRKTSSQIPDLYQQKIQESLMKTAKPYNIQMNAELGDVIQHSKFGKGIVLKTIPPDRMEVIFPNEIKVLACKCS